MVINIRYILIIYKGKNHGLVQTNYQHQSQRDSHANYLVRPEKLDIFQVIKP